MKKALKILGVTLLALFIVSIIVPSKKKKDNPVIEDERNSVGQRVITSTTKQYVEIYKFKGNGVKKSSAFSLTGSAARLKYHYKSQGDMGLFSVYVVDEGVDIMKEGGIPEVMIQESEESESSIQKSAGRYYLNVNAVGNWEVSVEEER